METLPSLSQAASKYLHAIAELQSQGDVRQIDVARHLDVSPSTCFESILRLITKGLVAEDEHKRLTLTEEGQKVHDFIAQNKFIFAHLFREVLGRCCQDANTIAAKIEPILDLETTLEMCRFNNFLEDIRGRKVDFWEEWKKFKLDPSIDEPCRKCVHRAHCLKNR